MLLFWVPMAVFFWTSWSQYQAVYWPVQVGEPPAGASWSPHQDQQLHLRQAELLLSELCKWYLSHLSPRTVVTPHKICSCIYFPPYFRSVDNLPFHAFPLSMTAYLPCYLLLSYLLSQICSIGWCGVFSNMYLRIVHAVFINRCLDYKGRSSVMS